MHGQVEGELGTQHSTVVMMEKRDLNVTGLYKSSSRRCRLCSCRCSHKLRFHWRQAMTSKLNKEFFDRVGIYNTNPIRARNELECCVER